jgi:hypothetical protein
MKCQKHQKKIQGMDTCNMMETYKKNKRKPRVNPTANPGDQIKHMI